ncbi:16S rRNA (adenine(1518)-N(6)/adenine(1519)-N(6))-dimethyltransferase RsmA [Sporomusa acidovorans]|uniref:Ribosomal RNA small subunit methyltransferase A n=1 Tax=Sporomusa acidovorans (strain ATCC 49682 / DSM 3132 / Mol) TaxID=1123286 RepID=A0ABZ3IX33_SPOA4|nr:16S rRNA (adenine(1518)-N(6)/adenine(1519)-N(6))-dimethyltransferase RsmA [Sporomusa acidovorans]OZC14009.1 ribosomal RNA small subunit methyltransferase A [Sporomusa acidovorans DSM 3132]SDF22288.1 16S rRNA (adenine1518-N6/adenine1519-N6)-dimethyltransferase [Sporomusa acidovorans]
MALKPRIAQKEVTLHILKTFGLHMSKKLGQNFLIDSTVVDGIVAAAKVSEGDPVLEIGPGIGTLTQGLAEAGAEVTAVELDRRLLAVLSKTLAGYEHVRIIHGDILKIDISREINKEKYKVIANLPYYITTPIIMKFLEERFPVELLVTMVQKEVAERMVAKPGGKDYGALSVAVQYYTEPEIMFIVPPQAFIPPPAVESAVIRCTVRSKPPVEVVSEKLFFRVVKAAFAQRRKTLTNALKGGGLNKETVDGMLSEAGIDGGRRGEQLSLTEFAAVANAWAKRTSSC